jgi:class 3 adenylate cyclase
LAQQGYRVATAENGTQAFRSLLERKFDLLLLDIAMPEMDGFEVLRRLKADDRLRHLPVIMISGVDQTESVIRCIEMGAEDFMPKPFNPVLLRARIEASLEKKRLRDQEQAHLLRLQAEQQKSESLLLNILPQPIAERLKTGESTIVDAFPDVTVLFADLADFTQFTSLFRPSEVVEYLNEIFSEFDRLADQHQVEKIKTIGDAYMLVGGLPTHRPDHAEAVANLALAMRDVLDRVGRERSPSLQIRIGISSGPVIAGIIGTRKFTYDLWGDTVNIASRMEAYGQPGQIQVAPSTYERLKDSFEFRPRGLLEIKGKGAMPGYFLVGKKASA